MLRNNKKPGLSIAILALLFIMFSGNENVKAQVNVSINIFYDALKPHGAWFNYGNYGLCWKPYHMDHNWTPYSNGHWYWTNYGWTWASDYSWGWAPFHYGRWVFDDWDGWVWIPDNEWGPAWVEWRYSDDYIGWAPLPPHVHMNRYISYDYDDYGVNYIHWNFVSCRNFLDIHFNFIPHHRSYSIFHRTKNITNITYIDNRVYNHGPKVRDIERSSGRRITEYRIVEDRNIRNERSYNVENNNLRIYRPESSRSTGSTRTGNEIRNERPQINNPFSNNNERERIQNNSDRTSNRNINSDRTTQKPERIEKKEDSRNTTQNQMKSNTERNRNESRSAESRSYENKSSEKQNRIEKKQDSPDRSTESRSRSNESRERNNSRPERSNESRERR